MKALSKAGIVIESKYKSDSRYVSCYENNSGYCYIFKK